MSQKRKKQFDERHQKIIKVAEQLLLDSAVYDLTLDNLAEQLDLAKGTLYKHFASKDELLLSVLIEYEKKALQPTLITDGASASVVRVMLFYLNFPQHAVMMANLEERLSATVVGFNRLFDELYATRHQGAENLLGIATRYLHDQNSTLDPVEYLSTVFAMIHGGAMLLNSSFYQRFVGERESLKWSLVHQALILPQLYRNDNLPQIDDVALPDTDPNAPPKLIKPLVPPVV
ncbi:MAG: TetR/AcrR family transcriptional regulator [Moraxella sp.]|nr:TetR/AcrR family transcriptional regulator [Moraxella sp.]